ncbi:MAG: hypothetical protein ACO3JL_00380 [Myxococcota bacterium]|jgi:hypothetical protein
MSHLWHDQDWQPVKQLDVNRVLRRFDDEQDLLPQVVHQLPSGGAGFAKLDEAYEIAAAQMDQGLRGSQFLHGRVAPAHVAAASRGAAESPEAADETRTLAAMPRLGQRHDHVLAAQEARHIDDQVVKAAEAGNQPRRVSNATTGSHERRDAAQAVKTLAMAEGIGVTMAAVAAGQALDPTAGTLAAEAASVVKAASFAKTAVGMTRPMEEMPASDRAELLGRALQRRRAAAPSEGETEVG